MSDTNLEVLIESIAKQSNGVVLSDLIQTLIQTYGAKDTPRVIEVLMDYVKQGKIKHYRSFLLSDLIDLVQVGQGQYCEFFQWCLTQKELAYWGVDGLLKVQGVASYDTLVDLALDPKVELVTRAKAIKSLALASKQTFDRDLPVDPGYWKLSDLKLEDLRNWKENRYVCSSGYSEPERHPALANPRTALEKAAYTLEVKLKQARQDYQDLSHPTNWLTLAKQTDMVAITSKWNLPEVYELFLRNFSPIRVCITSEVYFQGLDLYGASELLERQMGYSIDAISLEPILDFPAHFVVIADAAADPYCLDLSQIKDADAPVYTALHGNGTWEFELYSDSFVSFLQEIAQNYQRI